MSHIFSNITMKRIVQRSASRNSCIKCLPKPEAAHCTRRFASFSSGQPHNNNKTNVNSPAAGNWKTNGTPEIIIGATIVALVGIDQILQRYNDDQIQVNKISKKTVMRANEGKQQHGVWKRTKQRFEVMKKTVRSIYETNQTKAVLQKTLTKMV